MACFNGFGAGATSSVTVIAEDITPIDPIPACIGKELLITDVAQVDAAFAEADHVVEIGELHFDRFNSTPLELDAALVEYNRGTGQWTIHTNNQFPGFAAIMMGPAMRVGLDKLRIVTQDIGGGFGNKITSHPQLVVCCLLARKLKRAIQWTEWRTDQHTANAHGNERWFMDVEVGVMADGTMTGFKVKAVIPVGEVPKRINTLVMN